MYIPVHIPHTQELETPEQRAAREAAYAAALRAYKSKVGLQVDSEAEEEAEGLYNQVGALFCC